MKRQIRLFILILILCAFSCSQTDRPVLTVKETPAPTAIPSSNKKITVNLDFKIENLGSGKPKIVGTTNLPDDTKLGLWIKGSSVQYNGQTDFVVKGGKFQSSEFSLNSNRLTKGNYTADVSMPAANFQPENVRSIIGEKAENLTGNLVKSAPIDGLGNSVNLSKPFEIK